MFRSLNFNEIVEIRKKEKYAKELEKEVVQIIKKFETKKNLMMFFPYNINFDLNDDFESGKNQALNSIYSDFKKLFQYRTENCAEYDTYIAFIYQARNFMITRWTGEKLEYVDIIPTQRSTLFCNLERYSGKPLAGGI